MIGLGATGGTSTETSTGLWETELEEEETGGEGTRGYNSEDVGWDELFVRLRPATLEKRCV